MNLKEIVNGIKDLGREDALSFLRHRFVGVPAEDRMLELIVENREMLDVAMLYQITERKDLPITLRNNQGVPQNYRAYYHPEAFNSGQSKVKAALLQPVNANTLRPVIVKSPKPVQALFAFDSAAQTELYRDAIIYEQGMSAKISRLRNSLKQEIARHLAEVVGVGEHLIVMERIEPAKIVKQVTSRLSAGEMFTALECTECDAQWFSALGDVVNVQRIASSQGYLYHDFKPNNLLLSDWGGVVVDYAGFIDLNAHYRVQGNYSETTVPYIEVEVSPGKKFALAGTNPFTDYGVLDAIQRNLTSPETSIKVSLAMCLAHYLVSRRWVSRSFFDQFKYNEFRKFKVLTTGEDSTFHFVYDVKLAETGRNIDLERAQRIYNLMLELAGEWHFVNGQGLKEGRNLQEIEGELREISKTISESTGGF